MTRKMLIALLWGALAVSIASADTIIPGGYVSRIWTLAGSPYLVQGDITVHADSMLTIEPGVVVNGVVSYIFTVNGYLEAVGTETDSIHFTNGHVSFQNSPDSSHLIYCAIIDGFGNVIYMNSNPVISHSTITGGSYGISVSGSSSPEISHCNVFYSQTAVFWQSTAGGTISDCIISYNSNLGGIWLYSNAELTLIDCIISDNTSNNPGGGVRSSSGGTLNLINCTISDNTAPVNHGGGVACSNGTATFTNCTINGNFGSNSTTPTQGGGGISLYNASGTLSYCTIFDNFSPEYGAGIAITNGNLAVDHCTIDGNSSWDSRSGISIVDGAIADITNSIISNNYDGYGIYNSGTLTVEYTDFYNNPGGNIDGSVPSGFGVLDTVNTNGDSCDAYFNIFLDPLYVDQVNFDVHLTEDSPCIDAGDPASPLDPDNTITDMGRYYFDQGTPVIGRGQNQEIPTEFRLCSPYPNPFNPVTTFKVELPVASWVALVVYDISGRSLGFVLDGWRSAGYHEVTFDAAGLASGVYVYRLEAGEFSASGKMVLMK